MAKLISYPQQRALEDAAHANGVVPTKIFTILLPIWRVEVRASVTEGEDYELIDRYLERAIAEAGLDTIADLARFLALDEVIVDRAMRFLTAIEHVRSTGGRFALTELGARSVRDQKSYRITRHDRRQLYFDAFGSRPLTRPYYDARAVTFIERAELSTVLAEQSGPVFTLANTPAFRREALAELARTSERDSFNLPERIDDPESVGEEYVYLPLYLVRGARARQPPRYLAYSQVSDESDPYVTSICEETPEIVSACEHDSVAAEDDERKRITEWLRKRNLDGNRPVRTAEGAWRVTLPAAAFGRNGGLGLSQLGSYVVLGNVFFLTWSTDQRARRRAMVERINAYLGARPYVDETQLVKRLERMSRQLELGSVDVGMVRLWATDFGRRELAEQLAAIG